MAQRLIAALALATLTACGRGDAGPLTARGTIEVPEIDLAPTVGARVVSIGVDEGHMVQMGDTVALLSQADMPGSLAAQRARVTGAEANLRDLERGARPEETERARAELAAATAEAERTATDRDRLRSLFSKEVISRQQLDNAEAAARVASERRRSAAEALALLEAGSRRDRIAAARAEVANARAALASWEARAADLVLTAPVPGRILSRQAEPGEFLGPGIPAVTLGEIARPWVRVFVPAARIAEIRVGDRATITVDGTTQTVGTARVVAINTRAEFTPRVALTEAERADLMFGVKLDLEAPFEGVHPGLWVSVRFGQPAGADR
ncbi:MAG: HlyD family efflux transporter periplasmic adaptor subunit [Gemmatimonadetes bacterium]|nr:HlyD family efflux transporter periplasmic adaptor subunit [Gemmatimonadota bacterium]